MYSVKITFAIQFRGNTMKNANLNPREMVNFCNYAKMYTRGNIYVHTGCEIRIFYHWPPGQCIFETHRPVIGFTGPNYSHLYENIKIAKYIYHGAKIERKLPETFSIDKEKCISSFSQFSVVKFSLANRASGWDVSTGPASNLLASGIGPAVNFADCSQYTVFGLWDLYTVFRLLIGRCLQTSLRVVSSD